MLKHLALLYEFEKILAILGILFSILLIIWGGINGKMLAPIIGTLIIISCVLWLFFRENVPDVPIKINLPESKSHVKFWAIFFFALYTLSILVFYLRINSYERPLLFFIFSSLMAGTIACEILSAERRHDGLILLQILILGLSVAWTQLLITPSLIGIDPWYHASLTNQIINETFIPKSHMYSNQPIFHLIIGMTSIITTLSYKLATMASVCFAQITCCAVFIFLIAKYIFKNHQLGLLSALLVIILDLQIRMSYWSIPSGFGLIFIVILLYLIFVRTMNTPKIILTILMLLIMVSIILTHALVATCMAFFLFCIWGAYIYYRYLHPKSKNYISLLIPIFFTISMIFWWIYHTYNFNILIRFISFDYSLTMPNLGTTATLPVPYGEMVFSSIGHNLFFCLSILGIFYMISKKGNNATFSFALISVTPLIIVFIADIFQNEILSYRWIYIIYTILSIALALALYLVSIRSIKRPIFIRLFFLGIIATLSILMLMSPYGNVDNNSFHPTTGTSNYYSQSEIVGSDFFMQKSTGQISTDPFHSNTYFIDEYGNVQKRVLTFKTELNSGSFNNDETMKILRSNYFSQTAQRQKNFNSYALNPDVNRIYDNSAIIGYSG